jgi:hypothetical protein
MTFAPQTLKDLALYWTRHDGVNLGIVGDTDHTAKGVSYHLGADELVKDAYSARLPRDKAGLSNAASAIDLGRLEGTYSGLQDFSRWLVRHCQDGWASHSGPINDVREIIYSPDGVHVQRWSGVDNAIHTGPGNGDQSHTKHTHMSEFRDAEFRDKIALFAPYFEGENVPGIAYRLISPAVGTATTTIDGADLIVPSDGRRVPSPKGSIRECFNVVELLKPIPSSAGPLKDFYLVGKLPTEPVNIEAALLLMTAAEFKPTTVVDCDDVVQAELERASVRASAAVLARP